jgi:hypothetical protein
MDDFLEQLRDGVYRHGRGTVLATNGMRIKCLSGQKEILLPAAISSVVLAIINFLLIRQI